MKKLTFAFLFLLSSASYAIDIKQELELFQTGDYVGVITALKAKDQKLVQADPKALALLSKAQFKNQDYKDALANYNILVNFPAQKIPAESYYELAQINYAMEHLADATKYFNKSIKINYNKILSLYYIAVIHHSVNNNKSAVKMYDQVIRQQPKTNEQKEVIQAAFAQKAELLLNLYTKKIGGKDFKIKFDERGNIENFSLIEKQKEKLRDNVLPIYEKGIEVYPEGALASSLKDKLAKVRSQYELDIDRMKNGRIIRGKGLFVRLNSVVGFDSNVVTVADEANTRAEDKESATGELKAFFRKKYTYNRRYFFKPDFSASYKYHFNRDSSNVYQNDAMTLSPNFRGSREHAAFGKPASFLFDLEYDYTLRDWNGEEKLRYYNQSYGLQLGEQFSYFDWGDTTIKLIEKKTKNNNEDYDSSTHTFFITQFYNRANGDKWVWVLNFTINDSETDSQDTTAYSLVANYIQFTPKLDWITFLTYGLSTTFTDTEEQSSTRGTERLITPSISATKIFNENYNLRANYTYDWNDSKDDANYDYTRHRVSLDFGYTF